MRREPERRHCPLSECGWLGRLLHPAAGSSRGLMLRAAPVCPAVRAGRGFARRGLLFQLISVFELEEE